MYTGNGYPPNTMANNHNSILNKDDFVSHTRAHTHTLALAPDNLHSFFPWKEIRLGKLSERSERFEKWENVSQKWTGLIATGVFQRGLLIICATHVRLQIRFRFADVWLRTHARIHCNSYCATIQRKYQTWQVDFKMLKTVSSNLPDS